MIRIIVSLCVALAGCSSQTPDEAIAQYHADQAARQALTSAQWKADDAAWQTKHAADEQALAQSEAAWLAPYRPADVAACRYQVDLAGGSDAVHNIGLMDECLHARAAH